MPASRRRHATAKTNEPVLLEVLEDALTTRVFPAVGERLMRGHDHRPREISRRGQPAVQARQGHSSISVIRKHNLAANRPNTSLRNAWFSSTMFERGLHAAPITPLAARQPPVDDVGAAH